MKEDFLRLLSAAMEYHPTRVSSPADLARFLNESDQTIHNWSKRGLPKTKPKTKTQQKSKHRVDITKQLVYYSFTAATHPLLPIFNK